MVEAYWLKGEYNTSDIMTKQIPTAPFRTHCDYIYWRPHFHVRDKNQLGVRVQTEEVGRLWTICEARLKSLLHKISSPEQLKNETT